MRDKIELVEALLQALENLDVINGVVRACPDRVAAVTALGGPPFGFTEAQAHYILDMPIGRQTEDSRQHLTNELDRLRGEM